MSLGDGESETADVTHLLHKHFPLGVPASTTALSELFTDSLELIEALFELEQHTGRTLSNTELSSLLTVADLTQFFGNSTQQKE